MRVIFLLVFANLIFLISCSEERQKHVNFSANLEIIQAVDSMVMSRALLLLQTDRHYTYHENDLETGTKLFSNGTWNINRDTIILKSDAIKDCYYVKKSISYQCDNLNETDPYIVIKQDFKSPTTVEDCIPKTYNTAYADLTGEKFVIKNDYLIYIKRENDCSKYFPDIKLSIKRKTIN